MDIAAIAMLFIIIAAVVIGIVWILLWFKNCMETPLPPIGHPL